MLLFLQYYQYYQYYLSIRQNPFGLDQGPIFSPPAGAATGSAGVMEEQLLDITKNVCTIQMDLPIYH